MERGIRLLLQAKETWKQCERELEKKKILKTKKTNSNYAKELLILLVYFPFQSCSVTKIRKGLYQNIPLELQFSTGLTNVLLRKNEPRISSFSRPSNIHIEASNRLSKSWSKMESTMKYSSNVNGEREKAGDHKLK